jgi:hypothetical protein
MIELNRFYIEAPDQWVLPFKLIEHNITGTPLYKCIRIRYNKDFCSSETTHIEANELNQYGDINTLKKRKYKQALVNEVFDSDIKGRMK